jgi:hypothetical protein
MPQSPEAAKVAEAGLIESLDPRDHFALQADEREPQFGRSTVLTLPISDRST